MAKAALGDLLASRYQEHRVAMGPATSGRLIELYMSDGGDTWTLVVTTPEGVSCVIAVGDGWQDVSARVRLPTAGDAI